MTDILMSLKKMSDYKLAVRFRPNVIKSQHSIAIKKSFNSSQNQTILFKG